VDRKIELLISDAKLRRRLTQNGSRLFDPSLDWINRLQAQKGPVGR
jgi:hypothetical protein